MSNDTWPDLLYSEGRETYQTIHLWSQILGKIKLSKMPWMNHSWHVTLMVTPFGLSTGSLPSNGKHIQISIDFRKHQLQITTSKNEEIVFDLVSLSVADFYRNTLKSLKQLGVDASINPIPNELVDPIPFPSDDVHKIYLPSVAGALHEALLHTADVLTEFRTEFIGKCSPVHFFWGSFDLAVTRFSGREAPPHPGGVPHLPDWVAREAYSHEVISCGFWPGNDMLPYAAYYCYIYPEPPGYKTVPVKPARAYYNHDFGEFILPYSAVQQSSEPSQVLMDFLHSTYDAAADLANWDRHNLEKYNYMEVLSR
jgi:hypothetical protein